jgi:hypothetical protein
MTTTITRLKQLRDWLDGKLTEERVKRETPVPPTPTKQSPVLLALSEHLPDRIASFREKITPMLRENGYGYFLACESADYIAHQKWCDENCVDGTVPYRDVWQFAFYYPRAFASKEDAAMFKLTFDATNII